MGGKLVADFCFFQGSISGNFCRLALLSLLSLHKNVLVPSYFKTICRLFFYMESLLKSLLLLTSLLVLLRNRLNLTVMGHFR